VLRRWLREVETLGGTEEMVCIYEPEVAESLSDEERRSSRDIVDCQEGSSELSNF
jgi:hypothetical protein